MKNLKKHNPDWMQAQIFSKTYKVSVVTSKVHLFMLEEIDVAIRCGYGGFIIKKKQFLLKYLKILSLLNLILHSVTIGILWTFNKIAQY